MDNHCRHFSRDGRELLFSRESLMGVILICHNQILDAVLQGQIPRPYIFQAYWEPQQEFLIFQYHVRRLLRSACLILPVKTLTSVQVCGWSVRHSMNGHKRNPPRSAYCEAYQKVLRMFCRNNIIPSYQTEAVHNLKTYDRWHNLPEPCGKWRLLWNRKSENSGIL